MKMVDDNEVNWKKEFIAMQKERDFYFESFNRLIDELDAVRKTQRKERGKMNIQITEIKELENGGAEYIVEMDDEAKKYLLNLGFITAIEQGIARVDKLWKDDTNE